MIDPTIQAFFQANPEWKYRIEIMSVKPYLSASQTSATFKNAASSDVTINFIISAFIDLGLRANEIISLKKADIDLKSQSITIKSDGGTRTAEFGREFASAARPLLDKTTAPSDHLLTTSRGNTFSTHSFANKVTSFLKDLGDKRCCNGTALRRTYLVNRIVHGEKIEQLAIKNGYETVKYILDFLFDYTVLDKEKIYKRLPATS